ncbi:6113_t:CDS:2, partial [Ambispora leptoticha]
EENQQTISKELKVTEARDYTVIVETDWLAKRMTYINRQPTPLDRRGKEQSRRPGGFNLSDNEEEYEPDEIIEEKSYIEQDNMDESHIVKIEKNCISIEKKEKSIEKYRQIRRKIQAEYEKIGKELENLNKLYLYRKSINQE